MNKFSTKNEDKEKAFVEKWEQIQQAMVRFNDEVDLESSAKEYGALRRHRGVNRAVDLLRIALAYSILDYSLRGLGMWCVVVKLADLSKTALLNRLRRSHAWLGYLVARVLMQRQVAFPTAGGMRIKLIDATVVSRPGSQTGDWRLHVGFDLRQPSLNWVEVTDGKGSENLNRFGFSEGDLCIADRGHALQSNIVSVIAQKAWFLVRIGWFRQPGLRQENGLPFDIIAWLRNSSVVAAGQPFEAPVWIPTPSQFYNLRVIARSIPPEQAEEARRRLHKEANKKGRTVDQRTLFAAGFVMLISNLPASTSDATQILQLYRFRWQIELAFKRLKSLAGLDHLRAKDPGLARSYLYAKLLGALLLDRLIFLVRSRRPTWFFSPDHPISLWRITAILWEQIRILVRGQISLASILEALPRLQRFLCDEPRKRSSQFASAQAIFNAFI